MALECLVFDCDGVILESVPVKTLAFARMAEPYGDEARDRLLMYHKVHGGVSRYKKFEWFFKEVLGKEITPEELTVWGEKYAQLAFEEVCRCELVPGIQDVLDTWKGRLPMYVCSGAPHEELHVILKGRGLDGYFAGIWGSPPHKTILLQSIVRDNNFDPEKTLMVGDAPTDMQAAEAVGTHFYGRGDEVRGCFGGWGADLTGLNAWIADLVSQKAD